MFSIKTMVRPYLLLFLPVVFLTACSNDLPELSIDEQSERSIAQGTLVGIESLYNSHAWLGLPFAQPPVGELRWKSPLQVEPWQERLTADTHGAPCSQYVGNVGGIEGEPGTVGGSEDCLYLSVYAPKFNKDSVPSGDNKLPVMVWVHGGSNKHGAGSMYDGSRLAAEQNVIVVSINYRLGPLGWFLHPALNSAGDSLDQSGNYGTLDVVQSLKWVQENIAAFGGDANNVTLFGESAGAFDTLSLMLSPVAKGLFHKAISQSGGLTLRSRTMAMNYLDDAEPGHKFSSQQVELYLQLSDGSASDLAAAKTKTSALSKVARADYLRGKSRQEIMEAYNYEEDSKRVRNPDVIGDGFVLPEGDHLALFADINKHNQVALMIGTNKEELKLYQFANPEMVDTYLSFYPVIKDEGKYDAYADYSSRMWKYNGVDRIAEALSTSMPGKVWAYRFDWNEQATPMGIALDKLLGAGHGMEIPFVFGFTDTSELWNRMYDEGNKPGREVLSSRMRNYWAAFAYNGDPSKGLDGKGSVWSAWDNSPTSSNKYLVLDTEQDGGIRMSHRVVTLASIEEGITSDNRLASTEIKCGAFAGLARFNSKDWPKDEYVDKIDGACGQYPLSAD